MSLLSAIPGLSAHAVVVPEPESAASAFDFARADRLIAGLNEAIGAAFPDAGCLRWLAENRHDALAALLYGEAAVDVAYLAEDMTKLEKAIDLLQRMYLKAFNIYTTRPPVVEVQEAFL